MHWSKDEFSNSTLSKADPLNLELTNLVQFNCVLYKLVDGKVESLKDEYEKSQLENVVKLKTQLSKIDLGNEQLIKVIKLKSKSEKVVHPKSWSDIVIALLVKSLDLIESECSSNCFFIRKLIMGFLLFYTLYCFAKCLSIISMNKHF